MLLESIEKKFVRSFTLRADLYTVLKIIFGINRTSSVHFQRLCVPGVPVMHLRPKNVRLKINAVSLVSFALRLIPCISQKAFHVTA
jgi:hypothetical protein